MWFYDCAESQQISEHGILVWDVETKESEFVPTHNDYGYVTLDVENGKVIGNPTIPNKPTRVRVKDTTQSQLKKIISDVKVVERYRS